MKITTFNPQIVTRDVESVASLFEALGFERHHRQEGIGALDVTGIAYNIGRKPCIYKRPWPARHMKFRIPNRIAIIMGHTRMPTQGSAKKNENNHPFAGNTPAGHFALAHNDVLYNDSWLRQSLKLPKSDIEADSYIAAQLIERQGALDFSSLAYMAEQVEGTFCFTVLDDANNLYFVKGNSHFFVINRITNLAVRITVGLYSCYLTLYCTASTSRPQYVVPSYPQLSPLIPPKRANVFRFVFKF